MEREGHLKRWLIPRLGLNNSVRGENKQGVIFARTVFAGRPTGDSPEMMPLDCSLYPPPHTHTSHGTTVVTILVAPRVEIALLVSTHHLGAANVLERQRNQCN
jgi:hypothetical protein